MRQRRWAYSTAVVMALAGIGLKCYQWYHSRMMWVDEEMVFLNIRDRTLSQLADPLWLDQTAPLGWLALQRTILVAFGTDDRAVRAASVLLGMGTLVCAAWIGIRWMRPVGAALFVLCCSLGQWMTFYGLEAKPYAGDAFWALLLPALAVWTIEAERVEPAVSRRRTLVWWIAATTGQWFSYGAVFVAPGCAALLLTDAWRRGGWRRLSTVALQGVPWLISFGVHYYLVMRPARASAFLNKYWSSGMPPQGVSVGGTLAWLAQQAEPLAWHPSGTTLWFSFWLAVVYGIGVSFRSRPVLATAWLLVPLSACLFAVIGLVPLTDRLAFWILPALYAAVAHAADDSILRSRHALSRPALSTFALASLTALMVWPLCADIVTRGRNELLLRPVENHGLDDRSALRFLMALRQPGDVLLTTPLGLPAVWWYGGITIAGPDAGSRHSVDNAPLLRLEHRWPEAPACQGMQGISDLQRALSGARRAAVYLGFASDIPAGFQKLVLDDFSEFSQLVAYKKIADEGITAIFDLQSPPTPSSTRAMQRTWRHDGDVGPRLDGCVRALPARRW